MKHPARIIHLPVYIVAPIIFIFLITGCTASSPRFRSKDVPDNPQYPPKSNNQFPPSSEALEESNENDRTVDLAAVVPSLDTLSIVNKAIDRHKVMDEILAMVGTPYAFSGTDSSGIDCSGFTAKIYANAVGRQLPHSTVDQYTASKAVQDKMRKFGDLLFFNTTGEIPSHVGIYLGENLFAHASVSSGVTVSSLESSYYKKRYLGARRVIE